MVLLPASLAGGVVAALLYCQHKAVLEILLITHPVNVDTRVANSLYANQSGRRARWEMRDEMENVINGNICPGTECHTCDIT